MKKTQLPVIVCVPVSEAPDLPSQAAYAEYEQLNCPACDKPMWVGNRSMEYLLSNPKSAMVCMLCAAKIFGMDENTPIVKLTDQDH